MKKLLLLMFAFIFVFSLSACDTTEIENTLNEEDGEQEEELTYIGEWTRIDATLNGEPQNISNHNIILTEDTFYSSNPTCAIEGDLMVFDDIIDVTVTTHNCPTDVGNNFIFSFALSENGQILIMTNTQFGGTMIDTLQRVNNEDIE